MPSVNYQSMLSTARNVFMLGIAGTGMRGLAYLLHAQGKHIVGTDQLYEQPITDSTMQSYTIISEYSAPAYLEQTDIVVYSDAVQKQHPLRLLCERLKIPTLAYHEALGQFAHTFTTIAVTGTHGKSSTTALLAHILLEAEVDPVALVGARVRGWAGGNARFGQGRNFVVEADEYREHFLTLQPNHAIITSIDFDHPDYFSSITSVEHAFQKFLLKLDPHGTVVTLRSIIDSHPSLQWPIRTTAIDPADVSVSISTLPGQHMSQNATLAIIMAEHLGVQRERARAAATTFLGLGRRMEELGLISRLHVISDYGHHPTAIKATIAAARDRYPGKKLLVLFEAHTLERLTTFFRDFQLALRTADGILLVPTFVPTGREQETAQAHVKLLELQQALTALQPATWAVYDYAELGKQLINLAPRFGVALAFTAGVLDMHLRTLFSST